MAAMTEEDRAAGHAAVNNGLHPMCSGGDTGHRLLCTVVAQAIADVRERAMIAERIACVAWVRDADGDGVANDLVAARMTK